MNADPSFARAGGLDDAPDPVANSRLSRRRVQTSAGRSGDGVWLVTSLAACAGSVTASGGGTGGVGVTDPNDPLAAGPSGLHRLSRLAYDNRLADLLGDTSRPGHGALPEDVARSWGAYRRCWPDRRAKRLRCHPGGIS